MPGTNDQQLPAGLGGVPPAATPQVPNAPAGATVVTMPNPTPAPQQGQFLPQPTQVPPNQAPPPMQAMPNPMLTTLQPPPAPGVVPPPAPPAAPTPPPAPTPQGPTNVTDLAGALGSDPMIAPGIAYLEAAAVAGKVDVARAFGNAADELDSRFIDRAYLIETVGQATADQMIKVAESSITYAKTARESLYTECRKVAGPEGAWEQAISLFNQHADAGTKAAISAMFDSLNKDQMLYASQQVVQFARGTGGIVQTGVQPLGAPSAAQGLSGEAYRAELAKLPRNAPDSAYETLRAQRAAGKRAGLL